MAKDAIDFSYARPSPDEVAGHGYDILVYTGNARPEKAYLDAMRAKGIAVTLVQESSPNRAQDGWAAGAADAGYADRRADEVGYPVDAAVAYVVSDGDALHPSTGGDAIAAYALGVQETSRRPFFFYGNQYAVDAAHRGAPKSLGSWIPSTWGQGTLLRQEANRPSPIADTDLNTAHQEYGAWGHTAPGGDDDVIPQEQMDILGQWMKDQRAQLEKTLGQWMQEQSALIVKAVNDHVDKLHGNA